MRYVIAGFVAGILLNIFVLRPETAMEVYPSFNAELTSIKDTTPTVSKKSLLDAFFIKMNKKAFFFNREGSLIKKISYGDSLASASGNGKFYISYTKTGKKIELFNADGERFWKMSSREYPYLSYNGELVLLLNGDQSRVRLADINGSIIGAKEISGRLCTVISFSDRNDYAAVGFIDGTFYFINKKGDVIFSGRTKQTQDKFTVVKNLAVSNNGLFAAVHYGNTQKDYISIISIADKTVSEVELGKVFPVKTGLHISGKGETAFLSDDTFEIYSPEGDELAVVNIPQVRYGTSSIDYSENFYTVAFRKKTGESFFFFYNRQDGVIFSREFPVETYLVGEISHGTILLRGSDNLYSYKYHL